MINFSSFQPCTRLPWFLQYRIFQIPNQSANLRRWSCIRTGSWPTFHRRPLGRQTFVHSPLSIDKIIRGHSFWCGLPCSVGMTWSDGSSGWTGTFCWSPVNWRPMRLFATIEGHGSPFDVPCFLLIFFSPLFCQCFPDPAIRRLSISLGMVQSAPMMMPAGHFSDQFSGLGLNIFLASCIQ